MTRFKDFGSGSEGENLEAPTFKIHGEEFKCVPTIQGKVLLGLVADSASDDPLVQASIVEDFFSNVLTDESLERFNALTLDKDRIVSVETLGEIVGWLMSEYTARPEAQPEDSSTGQ